MNQVNIVGISVGSGCPFFIVAGPCVIEDAALTLSIAQRLKEISSGLSISMVFKASFDKANRTSLGSFRGPGRKRGLEILEEVKRVSGLPVLTDVHTRDDISPVADIADVIQIPAFLCRQTDLLLDAASTGKVINIKKGQFMAPWDMRAVIEKVASTGNSNIMVTERGSSFGYNNLVVDFRSLPIMRRFGHPVLFDATHSVQLPGGMGGSSGGDRDMAAYLARAAVAAGVDGLFFEVHPDPEKALCDGPNSIRLDTFPTLLEELKAIENVVGKVQDYGNSSRLTVDS